MIAIRQADVGYAEGRPILRRIHENIDPDDRIALLGANGNGKSTLMKLIANKLSPMQGEMVRSGKLRIGYFSQHQTDELDVESTPFQEMARMVQKKTGDWKESAVRARLGAFGFGKTLADNRIGDLSGGEKARLLFAFMSFDAPHLLLLDEPTNHLDMDSREALVQALNNYEGAIVIVSHDPSMVERVADRLWLVHDGVCQNFEGDLEDYRKFTFQARREDRRQEKEKRKKAGEKEAANPPDQPKLSPGALAKKTAEVEKSIARLAQEKSRIEQDMATPGFYDGSAKSRDVQEKYKAISKDLEAQESLWLELQEEQTDKRKGIS
jgi:ATP-binding cassette subfamily F protein 3